MSPLNPQPLGNASSRNRVAPTARWPVASWLGAGLIASAASTVTAADPEVIRYGRDEATGGSVAVAVTAAELIHINQLLPTGPDGRVVSPGDIDAQLKQVNENLLIALEAVGGDPQRVLKVNFYVANEQVADAIRNGPLPLPPESMLPAFSLVVTPLPDPNALIAVDLVVAGGGGEQPVDGAAATVRHVGDGKRCGGRIGPIASILPVGPRVYISGQAEAGRGGVADAARETLASLGRTLDFLGLTRADVVQVKAFVTPMAAVGEFEAEVERFFAGGPLPVIASVEWQSNLPIEIEMVVAGGTATAAAGNPPSDAPSETPSETPSDAAGAETIEFLTPPGMTASPIYCRVARVLAPTTIYTTGIFAGQGQDGEQEVAAVLRRLGEILELTGSDWRQLVKATYYVASDATSQELNRQRPKHYDPTRPPAASKAMVAGTGLPGHFITIDLIATRP